MLTVKQAAKIKKVTPRSVLMWIANGRLKATRTKTTTNRHGYMFEIDPSDLPLLLPPHRSTKRTLRSRKAK
jgi:excisionase family DNA binding protein